MNGTNEFTRIERDSLQQSFDCHGEECKSKPSGARKLIDMRPLSIPPPILSPKRRGCSSREICCFISLGICTIIVFALAFSIWFSYDKLEEIFHRIVLKN